MIFVLVAMGSYCALVTMDHGDKGVIVSLVTKGTILSMETLFAL